MRERVGSDGSDGLSEVRRRLGAWRVVHGGRGHRLPVELWDAAVRLARTGDVHQIARALRLNPVALSRRVRSRHGDDGMQRAGHPRRAAFVELPSAARPAHGGCRIELTALGGYQVAIQFQDLAGVDIVTLTSELLRAAR